jgi:hypothetical protein
MSLVLQEGILASELISNDEEVKNTVKREEIKIKIK